MYAEMFILPIVVACVARTVCSEEIFREVREACKQKSQSCNFFLRKLLYIPTREYCFSHYVTIVLLLITKYRLLYPDWTGVLVAFFVLPFIANVYLALYSFIRADIAVMKAAKDK